MDGEPLPQALDDVFALVRTATALTRAVERSTSALHGLGLGDLRLLLELRRQPDGRLRRGDLAERLGVTPSGIARQLTPLERIGVVDRERHPSDARLALVVLTPAGAALADDAARTAREVAEQALEGTWSPAEQAALRSLLRTPIGARTR